MRTLLASPPLAINTPSAAGNALKLCTRRNRAKGGNYALRCLALSIEWRGNSAPPQLNLVREGPGFQVELGRGDVIWRLWC